MRGRGTTAGDRRPARAVATATLRAGSVALDGAAGRGPGLLRRARQYPRSTVALFAVPALMVKLVLAASTFGTKDMLHWADFTAGVRAAGPVDIYGLVFPRSFYNHPPLMGYVLWSVNGLQDLGISQNFTIRALASLCDVGSAFVLLALLRRRRPLGQATLAAVLLAVSPVLLLVSGYHGNTDPDFVFLVLLGLYLLVDRRLPLYAGMVLALAIGVKVVPMVVLPALVVYAVKQGRRTLLLSATGFLVVFALTWGPALLTHFQAVRTNVLGYAGTNYSLWGVMQIGSWLGDPWWVAVLAGPGSVVLVLVSALPPALAVWFRPAAVLPAVAWSLLVFLAFATAFGVQYLVWPAAVAFLVNIRWATAYNVSAGVVLADIYNKWSGGPPWQYAAPSDFTAGERAGLLVSWLELVVLVVLATISVTRVRGDTPNLRGKQRAGPQAPDRGRWDPE